MTAPTNQIYVTIGLNQSIFTPYISLTHTFLTDDTTIYGNSLVMDLKIQRGRMHELNRIEAGTATITVNNTDGRFWRYNSASPLYPYFQPLTPIQLYCVYNSTVYPVFTGMIESIQPDWVEDVGGKTSVMKINCVDLLKTLTRFQIYPSTVTGVSFNQVSPLDLSSQRVIRVLNLIATTIPGLSNTWPTGLMNIDTGLVQVSPLPDATITANGMNALQYLQQVADAESGKLFIDVTGRVAFQNRDSAWTTYNLSSATFTTGFSGNIYIKPEISDDDTFIYNVSQVNYNGTSQAMWSDITYTANQGTRLYQNLDGVIALSYDAQSAAYIWTERYKDSILRVKSLALDCDASPADLYPKALYYDLSTRITLQLNNTDNPMALGTTGKQYQIMGITHDWQAWKNCWHTTWQLWDLGQFQLVPISHSGWMVRGPDSSYHDCQIASTCYPNATRDDMHTGYSNYKEILVGQDYATAGAYQIYRGYIEFDTSSLSALQIAEAHIFLWMPNQPQLNSTFPLTAVNADGLNVGGSPYGLIQTNYGDLGAESAGRGTAIDIVVGNYNTWVDIPLNLIGIGEINPGGTTRFGLRDGYDILGQAPGNTDVSYVILDGAGHTDYVAFLAVRFSL